MKKTARVIFISGIDTDAGKTYATAHMVKHFESMGLSTVTQKFIQTGCRGISEDIEAHRRLSGKELLPEDLDGTTAPIMFSYPASAQLAAHLDGREIDLTLAEQSTAKLLERYDVVLIEGAGGLMVPITDTFFTIDYISGHALPVYLVSNGILGSINHTILALEAIKARGIELAGIIYNRHFDSDPVIADDTRGFLQRYLERHFPNSEWIEFD